MNEMPADPSTWLQARTANVEAQGIAAMACSQQQFTEASAGTGLSVGSGPTPVMEVMMS
jgi:hypothetical protein